MCIFLLKCNKIKNCLLKLTKDTLVATYSCKAAEERINEQIVLENGFKKVTESILPSLMTFVDYLL